MRTSKFRCAALLAASAIALSGSLAPSVAFAQNKPSVTSPTSTTVDLEHEVSLTINKYKGELGQTTEPLSGVGFKIEKVYIANPLNTAAGWKEASQLTAETASIDGSWPAITPQTDTSGQINISTNNLNGAKDFKVGVYKITEQQQTGYTVAKPFLVTLPFVDEGVWKYEQTVKPKNQEVQPTKTVVDEGKTLGDDLEYTIEAPVPADKLSRFAIKDDLAYYLGFNEASGPQVKLINKTGDVTTLIAGTDFVLTKPAQAQSGQVSIDFQSDDQRQALENHRQNEPGLKVQIKFTAKLLSIPDNGKVDNDAVVDLPNNVSVTTNKDGNPGASSHFGQLVITKKGEDNARLTDEQRTMTGAEFQLYRCTQESGKWTVKGSPINGSSDQNTNSKTNTFVTPRGANLTTSVTVYGVQHEGRVNNVDVTDELCVVETKAPSGFALNPEPQPVVNANPKVGNNDFNMTAEVMDYSDSAIGQLPATGEKGVFALMAAGLALLIGGVWARLRHNRKQAHGA